MVLVTVLVIVLGLVAMVLLFAQGMKMEYRASANSIAALEAGQTIEGARRYLTHVLTDLATPGTVPERDLYEAEEVPVGDAYFWLVGRPDAEFGEAESPEFGFVDEASKLNINTATREMIELLPNMTPDVAAAIMDWKSSPNNPQPDGAESAIYLSGDPAYACKNAPFESVEELRLVKGVTMSLLYGADTNRNGVLDENEQTDDIGESLSRGLLDCVTVCSREPNRRSDGTARIDVRRPQNPALDDLLQRQLGAARAKQIHDAANPHAATIKSLLEFYLTGGVTATEALQLEDALTASDGDYVPGHVNVNTAPREVLLCLPGIGDKFADALIALRRTKAPDQLVSVMWLTEALDRQNALLAGPYVTTRSYQFGADVVALGKAGHALRRSWMIFDTGGTAPVVICRSDWTHLGWPLGAALRDDLDSGNLFAKADHDI